MSSIKTNLAIEIFCEDYFYDDVKNLIKNYVYQLEHSKKTEKICLIFNNRYCRQINIGWADTYIQFFEFIHNQVHFRICNGCGDYVKDRYCSKQYNNNCRCICYGDENDYDENDSSSCEDEYFEADRQYA